MNFSQVQERLRLELRRRIERGTLSVSLLARQAGLGQGHVSNFLRGGRGVSLSTLDKLLAAQRLAVADLLPARREALSPLLGGEVGEVVRVPLVSGATAMFEPFLRPSNVQAMVPFPAEALSGLLVRCPAGRKTWERFVAVRIGVEEARGMEPILAAGCLVVLDRHYTSFREYAAGVANLYGAVSAEARLAMRYAQYALGRVLLRPYAVGSPVEVLQATSGEAGSEVLVGRVALVLMEQGAGE